MIERTNTKKKGWAPIDIVAKAETAMLVEIQPT
jgi:hypothetical protein